MKRFFFGLFLALPGLCLAQSNFQKGYVVTNSGDTLKGYINYKERNYNPVSVEFKSNLNIKAQTFSLKDCSAYEVEDRDVFRRFVVSISMGSTDVLRAPDIQDTSAKRDTVFLQVLQDGKNVTLYSYRDELKNRTYIQDKGQTEPEELMRYVYRNENATRVITTTHYIRQLQRYMKKYNVLTEVSERKLRGLDYIDRSMIKIAELINETTPVKSKFPKARFFVGGGIQLNRLYYSGKHFFANPDTKSDNRLSPAITAGLDIFSNPAIGKLIFRIELSLAMNQFGLSFNDGANGISTHRFNQLNVALHPQLLYNFYNTGPLKVYAGFGVGANYAKYSNNIVKRYNPYTKQTDVARSPELQPFSISVPVSAGVVIHKKVELSLSYLAPIPMTDYVYYSIHAHRIKFGVNYLFGKH